MSSWKASIHLDSKYLRILVTDYLGDDLCKVRFPNHCCHPRSLTSFLEALALWNGVAINAAIFVTKDAPASSVTAFFGNLWPEESTLVHYQWFPSNHKIKRLTGLGDFRDMYRLHGRGN